MKTWLLIFGAIALLCVVLTLLFFLGGSAKDSAEVYSDGMLCMTLNLSEDGEYTVMHGDGWNVLTVQDGRISVTDASCPSHDCMHSPANSGAPIVCLPNRLVIHFTDSGDLDAISG